MGKAHLVASPFPHWHDHMAIGYQAIDRHCCQMMASDIDKLGTSGILISKVSKSLLKRGLHTTFFITPSVPY